MKRILAVSDIHGYLPLFQRLLETAGYNPSEDLLILLGDYIDRGPQSKQTLEYVMALVKQGAVALLGNHEYQMLNAFQTAGLPENKVAATLFFNYGGRESLKSYGLHPEFSNIPQLPQDHIDFIKTLPIYYETDDYVFVHAGLDSVSQTPQQTSFNDLIYARESWLSYPYNGKKTVVFGHTPTRYIPQHQQQSRFWFDHHRIGIDLGVYDTGWLGMLELPSRKVYRVKEDLPD